MKWFRADLHVHSVLSPCGDLDMSPSRIIHEAKKNKLDIIGISDHNSTLHAELMVELGKKEGIIVFPGVEITSKEEIHCLAFFENIEITNQFQKYLTINIIRIKNNVARFGHQLVVNKQEEILNEIPDLLIMGLNATIEEIEHMVHELGGVFIPAHVDRSSTSIYSQLGFIPKDLKIDAIEFSANTSKNAILTKRPELEKFCLITNSDAHQLDQLGKAVTEYYMEQATFNELKMALANVNGRKTRVL